MMLWCQAVDGLEFNVKVPGVSATNISHRQKRHPTMLALSDDRELVELLLRTCNRPWKVKVTSDFTSYFNVMPNGDCKVVVVDDEKLLEADRGWLLNKIQNWMPQAFIVYIASQHTPEVERVARSRGAGYYLSKPVDTERLSHLLNGLQRLDSA
jgi:DNA-binding NtrC family response regulator